MRRRGPMVAAVLLVVVMAVAGLASCGTGNRGTAPRSDRTPSAVPPVRTHSPATAGPPRAHSPGTGHPTTTGPPATTSPSIPTRPPVTTRPPAPTTTFPAPTTTTPLSGLYGRVWTTVPTSARIVALTFDAGANADGVASILHTLQANGVPGTFFLTGRFVQAFPASSAELGRDGYRLGDHSVDHPYFTHLSDTQIRSEVIDAASTIRSATGADPFPLFRFPYGDYDSHTLAVVNSLGYVAVGWTVDTLGWKGTSSGVTVSSIVSRVTAALRPGEIVLMHVGSNPTDHSTLDATALPSVIASIRAAGYSFASLSSLVAPSG